MTDDSHAARHGGGPPHEDPDATAQVVPPAEFGAPATRPSAADKMPAQDGAGTSGAEATNGGTMQTDASATSPTGETGPVNTPTVPPQGTGTHDQIYTYGPSHSETPTTAATHGAGVTHGGIPAAGSGPNHGASPAGSYHPPATNPPTSAAAPQYGTPATPAYGGAPASGATGPAYGTAATPGAGPAYGGAPASGAGPAQSGPPTPGAGPAYGGAPTPGAGPASGGAPTTGARPAQSGVPASGAGPAYGGLPTSGPAHGAVPTSGAGPAHGGTPTSGAGAAHGGAPTSSPAYGGAPTSSPAYGGAPTSSPAYGGAPTSGPAYGTTPTSGPSYGGAPTSGAGPSYGGAPVSGAGLSSGPPNWSSHDPISPDPYGFSVTPASFGGPRIEPTPKQPKGRFVLPALAGLLVGILIFGTGGFFLGRATGGGTAKPEQTSSQPTPAPTAAALPPYEQNQVTLNQPIFAGALATVSQGWLANLSGCARSGVKNGPVLNRGEKTRVRCEMDAMSVIFVEYATPADRDKARVKTLGQNVDARTLTPGVGPTAERPTPSGRTSGNYVEYAYRASGKVVSGIWWDDSTTPVAAYLLAYWKEGSGGKWEPMRDVWARYA